MCFICKYLLDSPELSISFRQSPSPSLRSAAWDFWPGLAGPWATWQTGWTLSGQQGEKIGSRVRIWERERQGGRERQVLRVFLCSPRVLNTNNISCSGHTEYLVSSRTVSSRFWERVPRFLDKKCQCQSQCRNKIWKMLILVGDTTTSSWEGEYPAPRQLNTITMCGLAVVEGRTVNEEITINRLLSSRRVLNPTIIPALLTRPILSQIPDHNNELSCQTIFDIIRFYNLD